MGSSTKAIDKFKEDARQQDRGGSYDKRRRGVHRKGAALITKLMKHCWPPLSPGLQSSGLRQG